MRTRKYTNHGTVFALLMGVVPMNAFRRDPEPATRRIETPGTFRGEPIEAA
jgi:hypothetical protein